MTTTWIVIGHRAGARIAEHKGPGKGLRLVSELEHEAGRLRDGEINSDRPGTSFSSGPGPGRHPMATPETAHDHVAANFARELAEVLHRGRIEQRFDQLVLVAEPRFLGVMRGVLEEGTLNLVKGSVSKDLAQVPLHDLGKHLESVLAV
jgi:protein required for attachment to host cells